MMQKLILWLKAIRAPFFSASVIPVLAGTVIANREGYFSWASLIFALFIVIANHAGANLLNDYYDAAGSDLLNDNYTPFSGGSRCIQMGLLSRETFLKASLICFTLVASVLVVLTLIRAQSWIFLLGASGTVLGVTYSAAATDGMSKGWGELAVGMAFGPLAVLGSYLLQTNRLSSEAFLAGFPIGFLIMGVLILNEIPDLKPDSLAGKRNWMVRVGGGTRGVWIYLAIVSMAYLTVLTGVTTGIFPVQVLFSYTTIPLAVWITLKAWRYSRGNGLEVVPALAGNIGLHFLTGLLLCVGFCFK